MVKDPQEVQKTRQKRQAERRTRQAEVVERYAGTVKWQKLIHRQCYAAEEVGASEKAGRWQRVQATQTAAETSGNAKRKR